MFQTKESNSKPPVHRELEAAQAKLCPMFSIGPGKKLASFAFLSKDTLGLLFVPQIDFNFPEFSSHKLVLLIFCDWP